MIDLPIATVCLQPPMPMDAVAGVSGVAARTPPGAGVLPDRMLAWIGGAGILRMARIVCIWLAAAATPALAQTGPEALVAGIITALGASLKADQAALSGDNATAAANVIINRDVAPHMDFAAITREVVGKPWAGASGAQRAALEREFRTLLVHVLARLLVSNRDDVLEAQPVTLAPGAKSAQVRVAVTRNRATGNQIGEPMLVTLRQSDGGWRVHELRTDGVDVVRLYSANFAVVIERNGGVDGLIRALAERNALNKGAPRATPPPPANPANN